MKANTIRRAGTTENLRSLNQAFLLVFARFCAFLRTQSANLFHLGILACLAGFFLSVSGYDRTGASLSLIGLAALFLTTSERKEANNG